MPRGLCPEACYAFICMYDEAWWVCNAVDEMMQKVTGGNRNNMDFLAWYIDPGAPVSDGGTGPAAGFAPRRDPLSNTGWYGGRCVYGRGQRELGR